MSSRAVSEGPSISGHGITAVSKRVKRSRSNTPEGGLAAQQSVWHDPSDGEQPRTEPVKSEWQGFTTRHAQDDHALHRSGLHDAAGASTGFAGPAHPVNEQDSGALEQQAVAAKQEQTQVVNLVSTKRTGLKVKLKFKSG